jgi:hypothetical protein
MSKINRYNGDVKAFASEAIGTERTVFGDVTQSDELTDQITSFFKRGWGIVGVSEFPSIQDFSAGMFTATQFISYLHQMGVPEWNATQEYPTEGGFVIYSGRSWSRGSSWTVGDEPLVNTGTWKLENPVFQYVVSQLAGGDKSKVAFIKEGESLTAFDWFIYSDGQIYAKNGATGAFSDPLDFDTVTGIDSGVTGSLLNISASSSVDFTVYSGTANAIVLTSKSSAKRKTYNDGDVVRFKATSVNTGATTINLDGLGVKPCLTVTDIALPIGYLRNDVLTKATYNLSSDSFILNRETELGSNSNGVYERFENGRLSNFVTKTATGVAVNATVGSVYWPGGNFPTATWPAEFSSASSVSQLNSIHSINFLGWTGTSGAKSTTTAANISIFSATSQVSETMEYSIEGKGFWYES